MDYQDNLTPQQKKKALISIFFLSLLIITFIIYLNLKNNNKKVLLESNTKTTVCKVVKNSSYKTTTNTVEYSVLGKTYSYQSLSGRKFQIGEKFNLKYSVEEPKISEVIYTEPIITEIDKYEEITAQIISTYSNSRVNIVKFKYNYKNHYYERELYVYDINLFKKNNKYQILVNKKRSNISYLKSVVKISN